MCLAPYYHLVGTIGRGFEDLVWPLALWGRPIISGVMQRAAELTQRP